MNEFERVRRNILINKGGAFDGVLFESNKVNRGFDSEPTYGTIVTDISSSKISINSQSPNSTMILSTKEKYDFTGFQSIKIEATVKAISQFSFSAAFMTVVTTQVMPDFYQDGTVIFTNFTPSQVDQTNTIDINLFIGSNSNVNNHYLSFMISDIYYSPGSIDITKIELI